MRKIQNDKIMMMANAETAKQAHDIVLASFHRLQAIKKTYYCEYHADIDIEIKQTKDRLTSIKHVLEMS